MGPSAVVLQLGGALPVVGVLVALMALAIVVYALREDSAYHNVGTSDQVVCPRCRHATAGTDAVCPECGKDLT
ncbi:hypothetical protein [Haloarcula marina]|uniref:hypothetical protein n=1 Tax=Haloarcula marina TaxID=2961574 RepID=UPI0020B715E2|nr:hypothetical protein [Halomicroarcula marina]